MKPKIAIAGASGFIGKWFIDKFHDQLDIVALSRKEHTNETRQGVNWKACDLYSLSSTIDALSGVDYALYLVHSMSPSTKLNQGTFEDTDLLLADNFARAAEQCHLKQIVYVGGILPKGNVKFSRHLQSRYEVENTLMARSTPVTTLRAGIIIGPGGSSFNIVQKLVERLPAMACPKWCQSLSQPIDIDDMLHIIIKSLGNQDLLNRAVEVGGDETISYMDLLRNTSRRMGKKRIIFSVPFFTLGLSKLWVGLFSGSSPKLVSPLVESLRHDMTLESSLRYPFEIKYTEINESIKKALTKKKPKLPTKTVFRKIENTVRSVQRLPNPARIPVETIAREYPNWLQRLFGHLISVKEIDNYLYFSLAGINLLILKYVPDRSDDQRQLFYITGGQLAKRTDYGWLEFRSVLKNESVIAAIHEFIPRLPWAVYKITQAKAHLWVMNQFGRHIQKKAA